MFGNKINSLFTLQGVKARKEEITSPEKVLKGLQFFVGCLLQVHYGSHWYGCLGNSFITGIVIPGCIHPCCCISTLPPLEVQSYSWTKETKVCP